MMRRIALVLVLCIALAAPRAMAQYGTLDTPTLIVKTVPARPSPGDTVHISVESPLVELSHNTITWIIGGVELVSETGATTVSIVAGKLGSDTEIVVVAQTDLGPVQAEAHIIPAEVDLLYDANSYVPPFYVGRALPSPASSVRLHANARVMKPGSGTIPPEQLVYTWKRNGATLSRLSGRGKTSITVPAPTLFGADLFAVEAATSDGTIAAEATVLVPSIEPVVVLFDDSPLFGIRYRNALNTNTQLPGSEFTVAAIPFFALANSPADPRLRYMWRVNGADVPPDKDRPDEVTLGADSGGGRADVRLELTHTTDLLMESFAELRLILSGGGRGSGQGAANPFTQQSQ